MLNDTYDYIVVGAGSAGCVLAARLTEDPACQVLLLENGGTNRSLFINMPTALSIPMNRQRFNWGFSTQPEPYADNRELDCPRGRGLGGSSAINGLVYARGNAKDFDEWQQLGATGWSYRDCLPYFQRAERWCDGADDYRGGNGPLAVGKGNGMRNPLYQAFVAAGVEAGYPATQDANGWQQDGFGAMHMTVDSGVRASTAKAYLRPAQARKNLTVVTNALAHRILCKSTKAQGIEYSINGRQFSAQASVEVILCAGAIGSPTILERSGIGDAQRLAALAIAPVVDLKNVGANLQDHAEIYFQYRCKEPVSLNRQLSPWRKLLIGTRWLLTRSGLGATNHFEAGGFIRSQAGLAAPDIQFHFLPGAMRYDGRAAFAGDGFQVHVGPNKPKSRGEVHIRASDPTVQPDIQFNYLKDPQDVADWRRTLRLTREILQQPALDRWRGTEIQPGAQIADDAALDAWVRANIESAYHPCATCRMGDHADAVVDSQCRVHGVDALRIVDASIFPSITNANLNAPTIMLAEKAADLIRGQSPLPQADVTSYQEDGWQTQQRPGQPTRPGAI